jgi:hypothetical protein
VFGFEAVSGCAAHALQNQLGVIGIVFDQQDVK